MKIETPAGQYVLLHGDGQPEPRVIPPEVAGGFPRRVARRRARRGPVGDRGRHGGVRADAMLEAGDLEGYGVWKGFLKAVEELLRAVPGDGERVN